MQKISVAYGDGIGPEIMKSVVSILNAAGAELEYDEINIGEQAYLSGHSSGIPEEAWKSIKENKIILKAPITTPQGKGYKSLNVTLRKTLSLFANVRPCQSYTPFIPSRHSEMDVVIVRENEEDLYAGIEHQQTDEVVQCLKLISRPGCERIVRYAFEYAKLYGRKKVTCFVKDNIMKQTDGLFHQVFKEIAQEYPEIESDHLIVDIGAARLADTPERFDVVVMPNLYGDILSDIAAQISGSVGIGGSSNIGEEYAMFEAIHGSAPDIAGQNLANPSGLLQAAVLMLNHIGQSKVAEKIQNAWLYTIEQQQFTGDIASKLQGSVALSTDEFTARVIANLGKSPEHIPAIQYNSDRKINITPYKRKADQEKTLQGVDIFVHDSKNLTQKIAEKLQSSELDTLRLTMITNRGVKVWPQGFDATFCTDHWRCRFETTNGSINKKDVIELLQRSLENDLDVIKTENLYSFNGEKRFSMGQGQ